jgi:hypothetical protein
MTQVLYVFIVEICYNLASRQQRMRFKIYWVVFCGWWRLVLVLAYIISNYCGRLAWVDQQYFSERDKYRSNL